MGLTLARKIVQQELCGGIMGDGRCVDLDPRS